VREPTVPPSEAPGPAVSSYPVPPKTALFDLDHDRDKGIFRLKWPDGETEVFRDKPTRYLVLEPDPQTGEMKPVVKRGCPVYLCLCREEREIR
jgi:hypothetical protein